MSKDVVFLLPIMTNSAHEVGFFAGPLILGTKLDKAGISVDFIPYYKSKYVFDNFHLFIEDFTNIILQYSPKVVSLYMRVDVLNVQTRLAKRLKEKNPNIIIIAGGPAVTLQGNLIIEAYRDCIDYLCAGEGENTIVPFCSSLLNKSPDKTIDGLIYYNNKGELIQNKLPESLPDDYIIEPDIYYLLPKETIATNVIALDVGRGCPFDCKFCATKSVWHRDYKLRNLQNIIDTIKLIRNKYGIQSFKFTHDNFTVDKNRVKLFCEMLKAEHLDIRWAVESRVDCVTPELLKLMHESGMHSIFFGIETGSPEQQKKSNKNLNLSKLDEILSACKDNNIHVTLSFIYGYPDETKEDLLKTLNLLVDLKYKYNPMIKYHLFNFYYGSEYYSEYKDKLIYNKERPVTDCTIGIGRDELEEDILKYPELYTSYYYYPDNNLTDKFEYINIFSLVLAFFRHSLFYLLNGKDVLDFIDIFLNILSSKVNLKDLDLYFDNLFESVEEIRQALVKYVNKLDTNVDKFALLDLIDFDINYAKFENHIIHELDKKYDFDYNKVIEHSNNIKGISRLKLTRPKRYPSKVEVEVVEEKND